MTGRSAWCQTGSNAWLGDPADLPAKVIRRLATRRRPRRGSGQIPVGGPALEVGVDAPAGLVVVGLLEAFEGAEVRAQVLQQRTIEDLSRGVHPQTGVVRSLGGPAGAAQAPRGA